MNNLPWYYNIFNPKIFENERKETLLNAAWLGTDKDSEKIEEAKIPEEQKKEKDT